MCTCIKWGVCGVHIGVTWLVTWLDLSVKNVQRVQSVIMCGLRCMVFLIVLIVLSKLDTNPSTLIDTNHHQKICNAIRCVPMYAFLQEGVSNLAMRNAVAGMWWLKWTTLTNYCFHYSEIQKLLCQTNPQATSSMASSPYYSNLFFSSLFPVIGSFFHSS